MQADFVLTVPSSHIYARKKSIEKRVLFHPTIVFSNEKTQG
jgi:hypothetical protein